MVVNFVASVKDIDHSVKTIIVVGAKEVLEASCTEIASSITAATKTDDSTKQNNVATLQAMLQDLVPGSDAGVSSECWFTVTSNVFIRLCLCVLPTAVSRHNTRARPHAITQFVKQFSKAGHNTLVHCWLEDVQHCFASGNAVSKALSTYSRKTSSQLPITSKWSVTFSTTTETSAAVPHETITWLNATANGIHQAARLVDAPANELHTDAFVKEALKTVESLEGVTTTVIQGEELNDRGFGGLYGVGKASLHPPALVVLSYTPPETKGGGIVMVGKGIVYDTGGLSIKSKDGMPGMKRDMGGAAAILGAFEAAVKCNVVTSRPLHAILCLAENAVSNVATRPDDVHTMYSGKTVEINNTDAEGRLVLGDGVAYAVKHLSPETIIDMATLTGAQGIATGRFFASLYCNNESLEKTAVAAGKESGDLAHPMPYAPEFFRPEFKSAVADMKNSVKDRSNAQVSCAGQFIANHVGSEFLETKKWLHIDMASPSFTKGDERATGYGVALLQVLLKKLN